MGGDFLKWDGQPSDPIGSPDWAGYGGRRSAPIGIRARGASEVLVYPNPTNGIFNIYSNSTINSISIYDVNGRLLSLVESTSNSIDLTGFENGLYIVKIILQDGVVVSKKIVKQ